MIILTWIYMYFILGETAYILLYFFAPWIFVMLKQKLPNVAFVDFGINTAVIIAYPIMLYQVLRK